MNRKCLLACLTLLGLALPAAAQRHVVDKADAACDDAIGAPFCTIGAAVGAAAAFDEIFVQAGTYRETGIVVGVPDLRIEGAPGAIVHGRCAIDFLFAISADRVTLQNLRLRAADVAVTLATGVSGTTLQGNKLLDNRVGVEATGAVASVFDGNRIRGRTRRNPCAFVTEFGIRSVGGSGNQLSANVVSHYGRIGISSEDDDGVVTANQAFRNRDGIQVGGDRNQLAMNVSRKNRNVGVRIEGTDNVLTDEEIYENRSRGVELTGPDNLLTRVSSHDNRDDGFLVVGNQNVFVDCNAVANSQDGWDIRGALTEVSLSTARGNGDEGFEITGTDAVLADNVAKRNGGDGFEADGVLADRNRFTGNRSIRNGGDGFDFEGTAGVAIGNVAKRNQEDGFEVEGVGHHIEANTSSLNQRRGFRDTTGTSAATVGNTYVGNVCASNQLGRSRPSGLCAPPP